MEDPRKNYVQSIERCFAVVLAFSADAPQMTLTEVAVATNLSKPTARRILLTLEELGYVQHRGTQFRLTPKMLGLGYAYLSSLKLTEIAQPLMVSLTDEIHLSTALSTLDGGDVVYVNRVHRQRIASINLAVGTRLPAHATSAGHVLLAELTADELDEYFARTTLMAITDHTLTTADAIIGRLQRVRTQGWAAVDQELEIGRRSAAVPIHDASGHVIAALAVSWSAAEQVFDRMVSNVVPALQRTAAQISAALGGGTYAPRKRA